MVNFRLIKLVESRIHREVYVRFGGEYPKIRHRNMKMDVGCLAYVVQDVFVELWKRKDTIEIGDQIQAFLYRAVYTRALNVLKHRNVEDGYCAAMEEINQRRAEFYQPDNNEVIRRIEDRELRKEIYDAINELPDKCKEVFKLSYLHDMKNKEIADVLGVSLRTVEAHMYKALKYLRSRLDPLWIIIVLFLCK